MSEHSIQKKSMVWLGLAFVLGLMPRNVGAQPTDQIRDLFVAKCASCHSVGQGDRVGPDLKGVTGKREAGWLKQMIQTPSSMLGSDADARALLAKYKNVRMPDLGLSDEQTTEMVALIAYCSDNPCELKGKFKPVTESTPDDVARGLALFIGSEKLENGGPPCAACHSADGAESLMGGGTLSKDLTHAIAGLGDEGLDAALRNPMFAVMNKVFGDRPLVEEEAFALRAFLNESNRGTALGDHGQEAPLSMPLLGTLLSLLALIGLNFAWSRRLSGVRVPMVTKKEARS